jgi:hypothetical protein
MADYIEVDLPDGTVGEFPSSMSESDISSAIAKNFPSPKKKRFEKPETLKDKVLRYGVKNPIAGAAKSFDKLQNLPLNMLSGLNPQFGEAAQKYKEMGNVDYDQALGLPQEKNAGDVLTQFAPEFAASMALPAANFGRAGQAISSIPKAGPYLARILGEAAPQMAFSAALSEPGKATENAAMTGATMAPFSALSQLAASPLPKIQKAASLGLGALGGGLGYYGLKEAGAGDTAAGLGGFALGTLGAKAAGTQKMMMDELTHGMNPAKVEERLGAAKRLGLDYLTPAEASRNPFLGKKQGELGRTPEGSEMLYEKAQGRVASEEKAINKLLDDIYTDKMKPDIDLGYAELEKMPLFDSFSTQFKDNGIIKSSEKKLMADPEYGAEKLPRIKEAMNDGNGNIVYKEVIDKNNVAYWDAVKRVIDSRISKAENLGDGTKLHHLQMAKENLVGALDKVHPAYEDIRYGSERQLTRQNLEKAFDRTDVNSGAAFFKVLASEKKFNEIMHNLRKLPEAQKSLKDMRELFRDFSPVPSIKTTKGLESTGMYHNRNTYDKLKNVFESMFTGGKFDKEAVEFITSPNWNEMMKDVNKISNPQKRMEKFGEYAGRALSQAGRKSDED